MENSVIVVLPAIRRSFLPAHHELMKYPSCLMIISEHPHGYAAHPRISVHGVSYVLHRYIHTNRGAEEIDLQLFYLIRFSKLEEKLRNDIRYFSRSLCLQYLQTHIGKKRIWMSYFPNPTGEIESRFLLDCIHSLSSNINCFHKVRKWYFIRLIPFTREFL